MNCGGQATLWKGKQSMEPALSLHNPPHPHWMPPSPHTRLPLGAALCSSKLGMGKQIQR